MEIVRVTKQDTNLLFTAVDKNGDIKIGLLALSNIGKRKPEWFTPVLEK